MREMCGYIASSVNQSAPGEAVAAVLRNGIRYTASVAAHAIAQINSII